MWPAAGEGAARLLRPGSALLLVALVYALSLALLPREGFWVVDNGSKYLQVRAALRSGGASVAIDWPGRELDPALELNPIPFPYSIVRDGEIHYVSPPAFALASALPYRLLGTTGLYLLPLASSLALLAGVAALGRHLGLGPGARAGAVLIAGLATPVWFYAVSFWEHAVAAGLCVWAVAHGFAYVAGARAGRPRTGSLAASAALVALGIAFRTDLYVLLPALLLVVVAQLPRERRIEAAVRFTGAALLALLPVWLLNRAYTGAPMGIHGTTVFAYGEGLAGHLRERGRVLWNLFVASHWRAGFSLALALPFLALLVAGPALGPARFRRALPWVGLVAAASALGTLSGYWTSPHGPLWQMLHANGLFAAAPVLALALLRQRGVPGERQRRWLWLLVLAYGALYALAAPALSTAGIHWGARFLLLLYPLLALPAAANVSAWLAGREGRWAAGAAALALVTLLGVAAQVGSIDLLRRAQGFSERLTAAVARRPERVVASHGWRIGQELARVFERKQIFLLRDDGDWRRLRARLASAGVARVLWVESTYGPPRRPGGGKGELVGDAGLGLYAVRITAAPLSPPPPPAAATRQPAGAAPPASPHAPASPR